MNSDLLSQLKENADSFCLEFYNLNRFFIPMDCNNKMKEVNGFRFNDSMGYLECLFSHLSSTQLIPLTTSIYSSLSCLPLSSTIICYCLGLSSSIPDVVSISRRMTRCFSLYSSRKDIPLDAVKEYDQVVSVMIHYIQQRLGMNDLNDCVVIESVFEALSKAWLSTENQQTSCSLLLFSKLYKIAPNRLRIAYLHFLISFFKQINGKQLEALCGIVWDFFWKWLFMAFSCIEESTSHKSKSISEGLISLYITLLQVIIDRAPKIVRADQVIVSQLLNCLKKEELKSKTSVFTEMSCLFSVLRRCKRDDKSILVCLIRHVINSHFLLPLFVIVQSLLVSCGESWNG